MTTMSERNPQKKINVLTSAGLSASLLGLYYSHADHLPDEVASFAPLVAAVIAWGWFKFIDRNRDGIPDAIQDEDSLGGAESEFGAVESHDGDPAPDSDDLDAIIAELRLLLERVDR